MQRIVLYGLVFVLWGASACSQGGDAPLSYDPPGSTNTADRAITLQTREDLSVPGSGVMFTNAFPGGRLNALTWEDDSSFTARITPENAPINNSAWYAFKVWAEQTRTVDLRLTYEDGDHRYVPKLSHDGEAWWPIDSTAYVHDTTNGTAQLRLAVGPDTLWVAAQELVTSEDFAAWTDALAEAPDVSKRTIGTSRLGRPIHMLEITSAPSATNHVLVISRQHPPEVTGSLAVMPFLETVASDTPLARAFRAHFKVWAVPLVNPDGVDEGHWRHNAGGVDLNRDWLHFNQVEPRQVSDTFLALKENPDNRVFFGLDFHSTQEDVFYTLDRKRDAFPSGFMDAWLAGIQARFPDYYVNDSPSDLGNPVSKNWFYEAFGATPVTYEVGDEVDRDQIRTLATGAAEVMMELLLAEVGVSVNA